MGNIKDQIVNLCFSIGQDLEAYDKSIEKFF